MAFVPVPQREEAIARNVVNAAYRVHTQLGPGLLENDAFAMSYVRQVGIPIVYDGIIFDEGLRLDVLVEDLVIREIKAVDELNPVWEAQVFGPIEVDWQTTWIPDQFQRCNDQARNQKIRRVRVFVPLCLCGEGTCHQDTKVLRL